MVDNNVSEDRDVQFKVHTPVFISLNNITDRICSCFILAEGNVGQIKTIYLLLRGIQQKYSYYFGEDKEKIKKDLIAINNLLKDQNYVNALNKYNRYGSQDLKTNLLSYETKISYRLDNVYTLMCEKLASGNMFPKVQITKTTKQKEHKKGASM